jgi:hypothetical protein
MTHPSIVALMNRTQENPIDLFMCLDCGQVFDSNQFPNHKIEQLGEPAPEKEMN